MAGKGGYCEKGYGRGGGRAVSYTNSEAAAKKSGILSVFCLGADAEGVTIQGAQYPLADAALTADFPLGVSNHFIGQAVRVAVRRGCLLIGICDKE